VTNNDDFFEDRQGAAVLKHGILRRYLPVFTGKLGVISNRVAYLDAYAGSGTYASGATGSPVLAAEISGQMERLRLLECYLVEENAARSEELCRALAGAERCNVYQADVAACLDDVLQRTSGVPLLAFFDPFGLPPPMDVLKEKVLGRLGVTELLVNITLSGIRRNAGHLKEPQTNHAPYLAARPALLANMDAAMGGDWWRAEWEAGGDDRAHRIFLGYVERMRPGWSYYWTEVGNRWNGPTVYYLLLLTHHRDGLWEFNKALSGAYEDFQRFTIVRAGGEQLSMIDPKPEDDMIAAIKGNIAELLAQGQTIVPGQMMREVFGPTLGHTRDKHVRAAVKALHKEGLTSTDGKGDIQTMRIVPA